MSQAAQALVIALGLAGAGFTPHAFGQTPADAAEAARQADTLRRQQEEQIRRDREAATPSQRAPGGLDTSTIRPRPDASNAGTGCRNIEQIALIGAERMPAAEQVRIAQKYAGQCLGVTQIEQVLGEITKFYIDRGMITARAYLPAQDLNSGGLQILVVEGFIEKITIDDGGRNSIYPGNVFPEIGEVLNLRDFEQGIDQVNRLSSNNATLDIQPGTKPGGTEVVVHNKVSNRLHANISVDNQGSESTGRRQVGVTLSADDLFNRNELIVYTHRRSMPNDRATKYSASDSVSLIVPFDYTTLTLSGSYSTYVSTILAPSGATLRTEGNSDTKSAKVEHVVYRNQSTRFALSTSFTRKASQNFLGGLFLGVSSRTLSVWDVDMSLSTAALGGVLGIDAGYSKGMKFGGGLSDPANLPATSPHAQFDKVRWGYNYFYPFDLGGSRFSFTSVLTGQAGLQTLYGSEQISIGGLYSVRGFQNTSVSGDIGYYVRNDLSLLTALPLGGDNKAPLRIYTGLDQGRVHNRVPLVPEGSLSGMAVGASVNFKGASLDVSATRSLSRPVFLTREPTQYWVRLAYGL